MFMIGQFLLLVALTIIIKLINYNIDANLFINNNSYIVSILNLLIFLPMLIREYKQYKDKYEGEIKYVFNMMILGFSLSMILNFIIYILSPTDKINLNIFYVINIAVVGPILEEYLFRGIVYNKLLEFNSEKKACLIATIIFAFMHINGMYNMIYAFIMGYILNIIYIKQKSLKSAIIFHIIINIASCFIFPLIISLI